MASFIYPKGLSILTSAGDYEANVIRALLERSTSTYTPNIDHDFLDDFTTGGGVEITVASYLRQTLGTKTNVVDLTNDRVELGAATIPFGNLESGQTVKSVIIYRQIGGDDTTPANDELILRYDGTFNIRLAANAAISATTIYVDPLPCVLANGTALDFGGAATCTLTEVGDIGERELTCSALGAAAAAAAVSVNVQASGNILPFALGGGAFSVVVDVEGLIHIVPRN